MHYSKLFIVRKNKRGLWIDANPIPPWEYRHHTKQARDPS